MASASSRIAVWLAVLVVIAGALVLDLYGGAYNVAADVPHSRPVLALLEFVRERSIVQMPTDLIDAKRIAAGAGLYKEMCSGCHLAPGMEPTEISQGLYPKPPNLSNKHDNHEITAARQFWVIKHGISLERPRPARSRKSLLPCTPLRPTHEAIVDRGWRAILERAVAPSAAGPQHMQDAHPPIIDPFLATTVGRQMRLDLTPLLIAQPKQSARAHF